jgi:hypothetical protein
VADERSTGELWYRLGQVERRTEDNAQHVAELRRWADKSERTFVTHKDLEQRGQRGMSVRVQLLVALTAALNIGLDLALALNPHR